MKIKLLSGLIFGLQWSCGSCETQAVDDASSTEQRITGGLESAAVLSSRWFEALAVHDDTVVDLLLLSPEFFEGIFDCTNVPEVDSIAVLQEGLRTRLLDALDSSGSIERTVSHIRARSLQSQVYEVGSEFEGCRVLRPLERHRISSIIRVEDATGESRQERRFTAAWVLDERWFLAGVPGPLVPDTGTPRTADPDRVPTLGPSLPGRSPMRVRPPRVNESQNPLRETPRTPESVP